MKGASSRGLPRRGKNVRCLRGQQQSPDIVGVSSGAAAKIAADIARELGPGRTVITIFPDTGESYVGG